VVAIRSWWSALYRGQRQAFGAIALLGAVAAVAGGLVIALAWGTASLIFAGLQAVFAFVAFIAASAAFVATWPQYRTFVAKPTLRFWVEWAETEHQPPERAPHRVVFSGTSFVVRAVIENKGPGILRDATINIVVPEWCKLEPLDPWAKGHYLSPMMSTNDRIRGDGSSQRVQFSAARSNITPGHHTYHARVTPLSVASGDVPVLIEVDGDPPPADAERFLRVVFSRHVRPAS
jgi:hypothetical protein